MNQPVFALAAEAATGSFYYTFESPLRANSFIRFAQKRFAFGVRGSIDRQNLKIKSLAKGRSSKGFTETSKF